MGGSWVSWMLMLLFFTDWLHQLRPIFTSLGTSINKSANIGAISNHTACLKASTQFKSHNLVQCQLWELLGLISMKKATVQSP